MKQFSLDCLGGPLSPETNCTPCGLTARSTTGIDQALGLDPAVRPQEVKFFEYKYLPTQTVRFSFNTPLGSMIAVADDTALCLLEFEDKPGLDKELITLNPTNGMNAQLNLIEKEMSAYFEGALKKFTIPIKLWGTAFQKQVWHALLQIPYGETRSYLAQATGMGRASAVRAVANANGANHLAIIIPCHRIIQTDGGLGGYAGGLHRKEWLLAHEIQK